MTFGRADRGVFTALTEPVLPTTIYFFDIVHRPSQKQSLYSTSILLYFYPSILHILTITPPTCVRLYVLLHLADGRTRLPRLEIPHQSLENTEWLTFYRVIGTSSDWAMCTSQSLQVVVLGLIMTRVTKSVLPFGMSSSQGFSRVT